MILICTKQYKYHVLNAFFEPKPVNKDIDRKNEEEKLEEK